MCVVTIARQPIAVELVEDRPAERRPFGRVGAGAQLVEQDERLLGRLGEDLRDPPDVRREGRERLLQALLVADVGEDVVEDRQLRPLMRRDVQARLGHDRQQADRLQRDRLAAGVRPGDDQDLELEAEVDVDRHDRPRLGGGGGGRSASSDPRPRARRAGRGRARRGRGLRERVPRPSEDELALLVEVGGRHPVVEAVAAPGVDQVELGEGLQAAEERVGDLADLGAEPAEDAADLLRLLGAEVRELRRVLGDRLGLDEDRLVAGAGAVDRALDLAPVLLGDRQDVVVADHREVGVAEDALDLVRAEHPAERLLDPLLDLADLAADRRELAAGGVEDLAAAVEARLDRVDDARELADARASARRAGGTRRRPGRASGRGCRSARSVSTVSASSSASSIAPTWARRTCGRMSCRPPNGGDRPDDEGLGHLGRQRLAVADLARVAARLHPRAPRPCRASRPPARRRGARTLSNSSSSSVCVSMTPRADPTRPPRRRSVPCDTTRAIGGSPRSHYRTSGDGPAIGEPSRDGRGRQRHGTAGSRAGSAARAIERRRRRADARDRSAPTGGGRRDRAGGARPSVPASRRQGLDVLLARRAGLDARGPCR